MDRKGIIMMSMEELRRVSVINQAIDGLITQKKATEVIGVSDRQIRRLIKRIREEGDRGVVHRLRGKPGNRRIEDELRKRALELYSKKYWDFGPTFASEKLYEIDNIKIDHETLRRLLLSEDKWDWQRKARPHRRWRERKQYFGEMVQIDGSHHDWLEGRGPKLVLMLYVDDATGTVLARFYDYEGTIPAMDSFGRYVDKYGLPQSIYLDKHTTYKSTKKQTIEEQLRNEMPMSQFERAMKELGVVVIHANSPQAKGRVERVAGTFQDRLIKELRLAGIKTPDWANEFLEGYLPKYNRRFSIPPAKEGNLHRKPPEQKELKKILCIRTKRAVAKDSVIRYKGKLYQIEDILPRRVKSVIVENRLDDSMHVRRNGVYLKWREIDINLRRYASSMEKQSIARPRKVYIPPEDHPWRRWKINTYPQKEKKKKRIANRTFLKS